ncbi:unnamed protein product [Oikopleura dioica]|uniref:WD repeat domain-containing protein 83 n=1 Tax=Oikopleura dioica TaxID=34765 RepID=E4WR20_OIKDI|nr:unnamed protein product [Oikopleura dioica]
MFRKKGAGDWKLSVEHAEKVPSLPIIGHALRNDLQTGPSIFAQEQQVESREWDSKQRSVLAVRWNADGNYCLSCGKDSTIKLWNPFKSTCVALFSGHGRDVTDVDCAGDSEHFVSSSLDKQVLLWDVPNTAIVRRFRGHAGRVNCVKLNEEGTVAVSGSVDGTARIWDLRSRSYEPIQVLAEPTDTITSVQISKTEIAVGCADGFVYRYDIVAGKLRRDYVASEVCSFMLADGCLLVQSQDGNLRLLDANGGSLLGTFTGHSVTEYRADCQMTMSKVYATCETGNVICWDLVSQKSVGRIPVREGMPLAGFDIYKNGLVASAGQKLFLRPILA